MAKNIEQVYIDNPITTNESGDLMYFGRAPYGLGDDTAMQFVDFAAQFGAPFTPSPLTRVDDTNVTMTLGGAPATALLQAVSITLGWTGTLSEVRGGTAQSTYTLGDILYSSAANTLAKLAGNTTTAKQYLSQTGNGAISAAPAWATISGTDITGEALTKTDDTNVTLTLGGTPATALLRATSLTLGWTGELSVPRGGTGNNTFTAFSVLCAGTTATGAFQNVSGVGSANQVLVSNGAGVLPSWQAVPGLSPAALTRVDDTNVTLTLGGTPATSLLQAVSLTLGWSGQLSVPRGGTGLASATAYAVLCGGTTSTGAFQSIASVGTSGQVLTSNGAGALPTFQTGINVITPWVAYTPTFTGFGTVSNVQIWSRRVGDVLEIRGRFQAGTPTTTEARITLGYAGTNANVSSSNTTITSIQQAGGFLIFNANSTPLYQPLIEANVGYFTFGVQTAVSAGLTKLNGDGVVLANNVVSFTCHIPVDSWP